MKSNILRNLFKLYDCMRHDVVQHSGGPSLIPTQTRMFASPRILVQYQEIKRSSHSMELFLIAVKYIEGRGIPRINASARQPTVFKTSPTLLTKILTIICLVSSEGKMTRESEQAFKRIQVSALAYFGTNRFRCLLLTNERKFIFYWNDQALIIILR